MKVKGMSIMLFSLLTLVASPVVSLASKVEEAQVQKESVEISSKIDKALDSVNAKYQEVETLKKEVSNTEQVITKTQEDITKTEASIEKRTEAMGARMQNIQANGSELNFMGNLLEAKNVSDFLNRAYAMTVLQGAEKEKVTSLAEDKEKLEQLKVDLEENKTLLTEKQTTMTQEAASLESDVSSLKEELSNNQEVLDKLANDRIAKEAQAKKAIVDEAKKQAELKAQKEASETVEEVKGTTENTTNTEQETSTTETPTIESPKPTETPGNSGSTGGGKVLNMQSTAYSYTEAGLTHHTATGIDLRENPRVIAVDPSVIPLGSIVEVSGYGMAIAGDTGGAIVGNIIDVHFSTVEECRLWGRRNVTVTIK